MTATEYFAVGTVPTEYCDHHVSATICTESGLLANEFCPAESRRSGIYIVGGSGDTDDGQYLLPAALAQDNYCTVHTAESIIPEIPEIPEVDLTVEPENEPEEEPIKKDNNDKKDKKDKRDRED